MIAQGLSSPPITQTRHFNGTANIECLIGDMEAKAIGEPHIDKTRDGKEIILLEGIYHARNTTCRMNYTKGNGLNIEVTGHPYAVERVLNVVQGIFT
jgi:hypothetical protein